MTLSILVGQGNLDPESIAKLLLGWVNGDKVKDIAKNIKRVGQSDEEVISLKNVPYSKKKKSSALVSEMPTFSDARLY